jgi:hypothetical protein
MFRGYRRSPPPRPLAPRRGEGSTPIPAPFPLEGEGQFTRKLEISARYVRRAFEGCRGEIEGDLLRIRSARESSRSARRLLEARF